MTYYLLAIAKGFADHVCVYTQSELDELFSPMARRALSEGRTVDQNGIHYIDMTVAAKRSIVEA